MPPTSDPNDHIPTGRAWCWEIGYQTNGSPVCVFTVQTRPGHRHQLVRSTAFITTTRAGRARPGKNASSPTPGRPLYEAEDDYAGGICLDPQNPNVIYLSSNAQNPFNLSDTTNVPLRPNERYELYRGVTSDGGLTFTWNAVTTNSTVDNLRPYIPRHQTGTPAVLWFRGAYATFTAYNCEIVGLFPNPVPNPPTVSIAKPGGQRGDHDQSEQWAHASRRSPLTTACQVH